MLQESYKLSIRQVLEHFKTDAFGGLETAKVEENKLKYGLNGKVNILTIVFKCCFRTA